MSRKFPSRSRTEPRADREPRLVDVEDEAAAEVFDALGSETARQLFSALQEEAHTASELADRLDCSVQNVSYHLERLTEAELVEVVDTCYSRRGTEMNIYAPADEALVVFAGEEEASTLRTLLSRIGLAVPLLALAWVVLDRAARELAGPLLPGGGGGGDGGAGDGGDAAPGGTVTDPAGTDPGPGGDAGTTAAGGTEEPAATGAPPAGTGGAPTTGPASRTGTDGQATGAPATTARETTTSPNGTATTAEPTGATTTGHGDAGSIEPVLFEAGGGGPVAALDRLATGVDPAVALLAVGLLAAVGLAVRRQRS